jgi:phage regulator Rha-like protein
MNIIQSNIKTMSSREISELTGSRHDAVRKSARRLEADQILTSPLAESVFFIRGNGHQEFHFSKRDSLVLVARLSPEFTAAIIDRWQELENNQTPQVPQIPQNFAQALQLAADQAKQLEIAAPKLEYHDKVLASTNGLTTTEIASELNMSAIKLNRLLSDLKVQRKIGGRWVLTAAMLGQDLTTETTFIDDGGTSRHAMKWTEKGRKMIHELLN